MGERRFGEHVIVRRPVGGQSIAELVLDRPTAMNALSTAMAGAISDACTELSTDRSVNVVLLSSTSTRAFCVGADLRERNAFTVQDLARQRLLMRAVYGGVLELPMPTIAAVHGYALGGGYELALACDLIVADTTAVVGLPEVSVGIVPGGGGTQLLPRRVGAARAAQLIFTGQRVPADEALARGLVDVVVQKNEARARALELGATMAGHSPVALRAAKRALREGQGVGLRVGLDLEDAAWRLVASSADRTEGIAAFNEKRAPVWPGE
ncbi:enoyl-CoA hydratase/isomerase family protein [Streptomyces coerulescens]|uniref:Enoyl-CoA hydratase/isomerase family protein n=1 Tax=Streptomyces coerulescens TaxID=29304 RepID=A0ABW0CW42_STRCD